MTWQPIETAPKDGTPIIVAWKDGNKWHARQARWEERWDEAFVDDMSDQILAPTHWTGCRSEPPK